MTTARVLDADEGEHRLRRGIDSGLVVVTVNKITGVGVGPRQAVIERQLLNELCFSKACSDLSRALLDHDGEQPGERAPHRR